MNMKPPINPPKTTKRPYWPAKPRARVWIRAGATLLLDAVDDDPPKPVNVLLPELPVVLAELPPPPDDDVAVAAMVEMVDVLIRIGC